MKAGDIYYIEKFKLVLKIYRIHEGDIIGICEYLGDGTNFEDTIEFVTIKQIVGYVKMANVIHKGHGYVLNGLIPPNIELYKIDGDAALLLDL